MKLVRPYVRLPIRLEVIARQLQMQGRLHDVLVALTRMQHDGRRLDFLLKRMFGDGKFHLDHDPPLCLRHIIDADKGLYDPDACDPNHLVYRTEEDHRLKTFVRGDGAQFSDAAKRRRKIKQEKPMQPKRRWPKGRKLRSRAW